jgi:hypothetical protein
MNNGNCIVSKKASIANLPTECRVIIHGSAHSGCLKRPALYYKLRGFGSKTTDNRPRVKGGYFETTSSLASNKENKAVVEG